MPKAKIKITDNEGSIILEGTDKELEGAVARTGSNTDVKRHVERWIRIQEDKDAASEAHKELRAELKGSGIDMKAFMLVIREHRNPVDPDVKAIANLYFMQAGGQYTLFGE